MAGEQGSDGQASQAERVRRHIHAMLLRLEAHVKTGPEGESKGKVPNAGGGHGKGKSDASRQKT